MDITSIWGQKGYSLLHLAVFWDNEEMVLILCTAVLKQTYTPKLEWKQKLKDWINDKTEGPDGYTALHFASFHGNIVLMRFLEKHGGNIRALNKNSLNLLHVAA